MNKPNQASVPASGAHTSGPWKVVLDETSDDPLRIFQDDGTGNGDHIKLIAGNAESDANLRLIAAAPDLLAALIELCTDKYLADPINADRMKNARAAILKAEGTR